MNFVYNWDICLFHKESMCISLKPNSPTHKAIEVSDNSSRVFWDIMGALEGHLPLFMGVVMVTGITARR